MLTAFIFFVAGCSQETEPAAEPPPAPPPEPATERGTPVELKVTSGQVAMVTIKNGEAEVPGTFGSLTGTFLVPADGQLADMSGELTIPLSSWDSGLAVRDDNVRDVFFHVADHPSVTFSFDSLPRLVDAEVSVGGSAEGQVDGKLSAFGAEHDVSAKVRIERTAEEVYSVRTTEPFVISIESLGLNEPLADLLVVCQHESVDDAVKVDVKLELGKEGTPPEGGTKADGDGAGGDPGDKPRVITGEVPMRTGR